MGVMVTFRSVILSLVNTNLTSLSSSFIVTFRSVLLVYSVNKNSHYCCFGLLYQLLHQKKIKQRTLERNQEVTY
jgi:hypothetical protein